MGASDITTGIRTRRWSEVRAFLQKQFSVLDWEFSLPHGWGSETYFAHGADRTYFVKLGAPLANYQAMASIGLTPPVIASGGLPDGTSLLVQPFIKGRKPSWRDFRLHLERMAGMINRMHHRAEIQRILPPASSEGYRELGIQAFSRLRQRWDGIKAQVPSVAGWVDESLAHLSQQIEGVQAAGTVAVHQDICNANWLIAADGHIYLIDLDDMSMDDPAEDLGALLWWYYSPELRGRFLELAGYCNDEGLRQRMRLRMAMHCLSILLPRRGSFDQFEADKFVDSLTDFRAILAGEDNPQGYG